MGDGIGLFEKHIKDIDDLYPQTKYIVPTSNNCHPSVDGSVVPNQDGVKAKWSIEFKQSVHPVPCHYHLTKEEPCYQKL